MQSHNVQLKLNNTDTSAGIVNIPSNAKGFVVFAHGSGSSSRSPRNQLVARMLNDAGIATALCDLLTLREEADDANTGHLRFDIDFLARRLQNIIKELFKQFPDLQQLPLGLFGASTGAACSINVASDLPSVAAVVSRGGRPDLARPECLAEVHCPILMLVGGNDRHVIPLNEKARAAMHNCRDKQLVIVPGATHLFEEAGTLEIAAKHAVEFFLHVFARKED